MVYEGSNPSNDELTMNFLSSKLNKLGWKDGLNKHRTANPHNFCNSYLIEGM